MQNMFPAQYTSIKERILSDYTTSGFSTSTQAQQSICTALLGPQGRVLLQKIRLVFALIGMLFMKSEGTVPTQENSVDLQCVGRVL
jgi:hypothetical protein